MSFLAHPHPQPMATPLTSATPAQISVISIVEDTTVDGPGFRTAIYCAGCPNACPGCHNPSSWDINAGSRMAVEDIMKTIESDPYADVTFSGGDPMFQPEGFAALAQAIKQRTAKTIWCYTGLTFEAIMRHPRQRQLLRWIDVLVDGPYVERLRDASLRFRGSTNQRIIDVQRSLKIGAAVWENVG